VPFEPVFGALAGGCAALGRAQPAYPRKNAGFQGIRAKNSRRQSPCASHRDASELSRCLADNISSPLLAANIEGGIDSIQLLFPDYIKGLKTFHAEVMPLLQRRELVLAS
jgi:hypothetical protein